VTIRISNPITWKGVSYRPGDIATLSAGDERSFISVGYGVAVDGGTQPTGPTTGAPTAAAVGGEYGDAVQRIAVPSYFYATWYNAPGGPHAWERMQAAAPYTSLCIVNDGSGPGTAKNADYVTQVARAKAAGLTVLGYVRTDYTATPTSAAKAQIDQHYAWYGVAGIFLDEADNPQGGTLAATLAYYADLSAYIKARGGTVIINPGQPSIDEGLMQCCDVVLNYENTAANYAAAQFPAWTVNYPARRFWHVIHTVADVAQRDTLLDQTRANRAGLVYLTTDSLPNPYDTLPADPFWSGLVTRIRSGQ
jgi:hypothetical protein